MGKVVIEFSDAEKMRIEAILMDGDADEALRFIQPPYTTSSGKVFCAARLPTQSGSSTSTARYASLWQILRSSSTSFQATYSFSVTR